MNLGKALMETKSSTLERVIDEITNNGQGVFREVATFHGLTLDDVRRYLDRPAAPKSELVAIGIERFGIAKSRLEKLPREDVISTLQAAIQHEESLNIISEEAKRGGQLRSS